MNGSSRCVMDITIDEPSPRSLQQLHSSCFSSVMPIRRKEPRPGWRCPKPATTTTRRPFTSVGASVSVLTCFLILAFCSPISAAVLNTYPVDIPTPTAASGSAFSIAANQLHELGKIVVDPHFAFPQPPVNVDLSRRQDEPSNKKDDDSDKDSDMANDKDNNNESSKSSAASSTPDPRPSNIDLPSVTPTKPKITPSASTGSEPKKTDIIVDSSAPSNHPIPTPFDTIITDNFTSPGCPDFFYGIVDNSTFQECYPVSLMLLNSNSFFHASRSLVRMSQTLDASCGVNAAKCKDLMSHFAGEMVKEETCAGDLKAENPLLVQAQNGLLAYQAVFNSTCLKSPDTTNYCFADAVTNTSSVENPYVYYLGIGMPLPASSHPTCNSCLQATMKSYSQAAKRKNQPITKTYGDAAQQINILCGPSFVPTVAVGSENSGMTTRLIARSKPDLSLVVGYVLFFSVGIPLFSWIL
ncbi:hypothetical protein AJ80_02673 [Polytolypa hystricis UAMH7299]|uniref:DUF7729 domain-containing protein n=1 Tax=Polytolypa hystricis (strain UAMH7299) TaxID=1447883 RepID=A0A2B7YRL2_POLH7|nr:hypothetical protein AJ80_02673 [Polytolypa hystricis UAMH7299]